MTVYLDIGAVHIQSYLARTSQLRGRRGASAALSEATKTKTVADVARSVGVRVEPNKQSGDADGKVSLLVYPETNTDETVARVVGAVFPHLRELLPGAEFEASWGEGDDYVGAYAEIKRRRAENETIVSLAPVDEFPLSAPCQVCRYDPAVGDTRLPGEDEPKKVCADCLMRYRRETHRLGEGREQWLAKELGCTKTPDAFNDLAELDRSSTTHNHLATIYADGNAIGALFAGLARGQDKQSREEISVALVKSTLSALKAATKAIAVPEEDRGVLCAVPHVVGGDDVLVTVPAGRGWRFVRTFLEEFGSGVPVPADRAAPTASAGVVFHHRTYPFNLVAEDAADGLRKAKGLVSGTARSLHFLDITTDGPGASIHPAFTLAEIEASATYLDALGKVPSAHRARLVDILTRRRSSHAEPDTPDRRADAVRASAQRVGHADAIAPFRLVEDSDTPSPIILLDALRIVRWWR